MSHPQDQDYDFNRDILGRSPGLVAIKPNYESLDSPPPLVRLSPSSDSTDAEDTTGVRSSRKHKKRKGRTNPSFADGVLIRSLDPNQNELASHAERNPLESASQSEAEEEEDEGGTEAGRRQMSRPGEVGPSQARQSAAQIKALAKAALAKSHEQELRDDWPLVGTPDSVNEDKPSPTPPPASGGTRSSSHAEHYTSVPPKLENPPKKQFDTRPPPLEQGLGLKNLKQSYSHEEDQDDSLSKSPALAKFTIARDDAPAEFNLPALQQKSPPRSSPAGSPDTRQNLPNIKTAIGEFQEPGFAGFTSMSPMGRPSPGHLAQYASPSPYSALSPRGQMGPPSHFDWRATTRDSNTSTSSSYASSSATVSTPSTSIHGPSPADSNPSPLPVVLEQGRESMRRDSFEETESNSPPDDEHLGDESGAGRFSGGNYKCTYPGCTAASFQTQYLLNSHMNVHSNTRTHFCPVKGCTRGPGGQGFKRKNEMIRCVYP